MIKATIRGMKKGRIYSPFPLFRVLISRGLPACNYHAFFLIIISNILCSPSWAQEERSLTGKVYDEEGNPLIGALILLSDTTIGSITDGTGEFTLNPLNATSLMVSSIGYKDKKWNINDSNEIKIYLTRIDKNQHTTVTTALGVEKKPDAVGYALSEITGEEIVETGEVNVINALSGRIPGINVIKTATGPTGAPGILIRGSTSMTSSNQPLYILDGIPINNTHFGQAGMWSGADEGDGTFSINPEDIQKVTILKGATAGALYGTRASNGVILITSKKGTGEDGPSVEYSTRYSIERVNDLTHYQSLYGHGSSGLAPSTPQEGYIWGDDSWGGIMDGSPVYQFDGIQRPYTLQESPFKGFYRTGQINSHALSLQYGDKNFNQRLSFTSLHGSSVIPNSGYDRTSLHITSTGTIFHKLTLSNTILYSHENIKNRTSVSDSPGNINYSLYTLPRSIRVQDLAGNPDKPGALDGTRENPGFNSRDIGEELGFSRNIWSQNPYWAAWQFQNKDKKDRLIGSVTARYDFSEFFYAKASMAMDWQTRRDFTVIPYGTAYRRKGTVVEQENQIRELNAQWVIGFNRKSSGITLDALVGGNAMADSREILSLEASDLKIPFFHSISNGNRTETNTSHYNRSINSLYFYASVNFNNYLYVHTTGRTDWLLTLNENPVNVYYPSLGISYVYSKFLNMPAWTSYGKLGVSLAKVGGTNPYMDRPRHVDPLQQALHPPSFLVPHNSTELEVNLNMYFKEDRIKFDLAWYRQQTNDDIIDMPLSLYPWASSVLQNSGKIQNNGIELSLGTESVHTENFSWYTGINVTKNNNKVVRVTELFNELKVGESRTREGYVYHVVGYPMATIMGHEQLRDDTGNNVYETNTGYPLASIYRTPIGSGIHPVTGGLLNVVSYKKWSMNFLIDCKAGGYLYSGTNVRLVGYGLHEMTLEGRANDLTITGVDSQQGLPYSRTFTQEELEGYWKKYASISNKFVYNTSFVKFRQLSFIYQFTDEFTRKISLKGLSVSLVSRNLFFLYNPLDNISPESNYANGNAQGLDYFGFPETRSISVRLKAKI
ncbi:MAG: SusC/RagA family TonB-linked outer membrane protein [Cyclobacteriaceae bacterium]|nr:SusC/RagA family TonB-linked outer membrane protein [Cyclobacteriaceae bacterium]